MQYLYLAHHGIKGQKWGVRRYQNPDGSLTEAGRKKYMEKYVTDYDDDGNEIYAYRLSKKGRKAYHKFEKRNKGSYFTAIESRNYNDPDLLSLNKSGKAPSNIQMLSSLDVRRSELFQEGKMFTNEYLAMNAAIEYGMIANRFERIKDEASWRYKTGRPIPSADFTENDFGSKKTRKQRRHK